VAKRISETATHGNNANWTGRVAFLPKIGFIKDEERGEIFVEARVLTLTVLVLVLQ